jgi:hypothetical protein
MGGGKSTGFGIPITGDQTTGNPQGPQMGFGFNPNTDMPFTGGQNAGNVLGQGIDSILGATPIGGAFNQALGGQSIGSVVGNGLGSILGQQPMLGGIASSYDPAADLNKGPYPAQQPMPTSGMGGGKTVGFGLPITGDQTTGNPQGPQIGFGPAPIEQNPMDIFGLPGAKNYNRQSPIIGSMPAPQPVNRFAPPNAPGVRQQPRTAPRAGIPVQSARTLRPTTRTRLR